MRSCPMIDHDAKDEDEDEDEDEFRARVVFLFNAAERRVPLLTPLWS